MNIASLAAYLGAGLAMGVGAIGSGWGLGYASYGALRGIARQPAYNSTLFRNMLIGQAITETPAIFSLVIAFMLFFAAGSTLDAPYSPSQAAVFIVTGLCIGLGSIGAGAGSGIVAHHALDATSQAPSTNSSNLLFMLIAQAWAQTGGIFALIVALLLLNTRGFNNLSAPTDPRILGLFPISGGEILAIGKYLGVGLSMGFGAIGSSAGIALVGGQACMSMVQNPESATKVRTLFFIGAAIAESPTIFALIISLILLTQSV